MMLSSRCLLACVLLKQPNWSSSAYSRSFLVLHPALQRVAQHPAFQAFQHQKRPLCVIENALDQETIRQIRQDATLLQNAGFGGPAGIQSRHEEVRKNVHQIWLSSCNSVQQFSVLMGNVQGRESLYRFVDGLRLELDNEFSTNSDRILPNHLTEASYLSYQPGAFYRQHVDCIADATREHQRSVSLLLYLGDPMDEKRDWNPDIDGGSLRIFHEHGHGSISNTGSFTDVPPNPGTLVLFDSATIQHEVLETQRPRVCVVGWFSTLIKGNSAAGQQSF